jgi:hypothetical protein
MFLICAGLSASEVPLTRGTCFVNFRHYKSGAYANSNEGVTPDVQRWLKNHPSTNILNFGFGDTIDTYGSGSYAWILYSCQTIPNVQSQLILPLFVQYKG